VSDQAEDPGRDESVGGRVSSFSSSLGPQRSAHATASADRESNGVPGAAKGQLSDRISDASSKLASLSERPEVVIATAFVGGVVIATILRRLAR
jgi:hypothetical protein